MLVFRLVLIIKLRLIWAMARLPQQFVRIRFIKPLQVRGVRLGKSIVWNIFVAALNIVMGLFVVGRANRSLVDLIVGWATAPALVLSSLLTPPIRS